MQMEAITKREYANVEIIRILKGRHFFEGLSISAWKNFHEPPWRDGPNFFQRSGFPQRDQGS